MLWNRTILCNMEHSVLSSWRYILQLRVWNIKQYGTSIRLLHTNKMVQCRQASDRHSSKLIPSNHHNTCIPIYLFLWYIACFFLSCSLTPWLLIPGGSMPHSQGLSNNSYPELNQPKSSYWYLFIYDKAHSLSCRFTC